MARPKGSAALRVGPRERLDAMFRPRSIAVIGASPDGPTSYIAQNLDKLGFDGELYPVNPRRDEVWGRPALADVGEAPGRLDLAVVAVAAERLKAAVSSCVAARVRSIMIYTAGLAELGEQGRDLQDEVIELARGAGISVLGPNCLGFVNVADRTAVSAFPPASLPDDLVPGRVGVVSQSGGLLISTMELGTRLGLGFSRMLSTGNEGDVNTLDCFEHLVDDEGTSAIGYVMEGLPDGRRFLALAHRAAEVDKPIVVLRLGRSEAGRRAALTHTASIVGPMREFEAAARAGGVVLARTPAELVDRLAVFSRRQRRRSTPGGLGILTMSGGTKVMVSDIAADHGVELAEFTEATIERLRGLLPDFATLENPLDLTPVGVTDPEVVRQVAEAVAADPGVATTALVLHLKRAGGSPVQQGLVRTFCAVGAELDKQFVVISSIPEGLGGFWRPTVVESQVPFLNDLSAFGALRAWNDREAWLATRGDGGAEVGASRSHEAAIELAATAGSAVLAESGAYPVLERAGIPVAAWRLIRSREEALAAADALGYPVVLKVAGGPSHKSDVGGVEIDIGDPDGLNAAWSRMGRRLAEREPAVPAEAFLVQRMSDHPLEVLVSSTCSTCFGPMVNVGLGGIWTEALQDVSVRLCPVTPSDARQMLAELRASALLEGTRGSAPADIGALTALIARVSELAVAGQEHIAAIELNPVRVGPEGLDVVDALIVRTDTSEPPGREHGQEGAP